LVLEAPVSGAKDVEADDDEQLEAPIVVKVSRIVRGEHLLQG